MGRPKKGAENCLVNSQAINQQDWSAEWPMIAQRMAHQAGLVGAGHPVLSNGAHGLHKLFLLYFRRLVAACAPCETARGCVSLRGDRSCGLFTKAGPAGENPKLGLSEIPTHLIRIIRSADQKRLLKIASEFPTQLISKTSYLLTKPRRRRNKTRSCRTSFSTRRRIAFPNRWKFRHFERAHGRALGGNCRAHGTQSLHIAGRVALAILPTLGLRS